MNHARTGVTCRIPSRTWRLMLLGLSLTSLSGGRCHNDRAQRTEIESSDVQPTKHPAVGTLAEVQQLDDKEIAEGDREAIAGADQSDFLVHGRHAGEGTHAERVRACDEDPRVKLGLVSTEVCLGAELFFRSTFGGNGRTCGSCHPSAHNYTVEPRFIEQLDAEDPLFVAERVPLLAELERVDLLREHGLFVVNADGFEASGRYVMRSVSHMLGLAVSTEPGPIVKMGIARDGSTQPPLRRLGWSGDGAPDEGSLEDFARGAIEQHATKSLGRVRGVDYVPATPEELAGLAAFSAKLGRLNDVEVSEVVMTDPRAERGRKLFTEGEATNCNRCHHNAGANLNGFDPILDMPFNANFNFDIGTERARLDRLNLMGIPFDGGFGREPFDADGDGEADSFGDGRFNAPPLVEAADTAPYFHTNAFETLEAAIHYYTTDTFNQSPVGHQNGSFALTSDDVHDLGRFLRVLNAAMNIEMALQRQRATLEIATEYDNRYISVQRGLLKLANRELQDAMLVLDEVDDLNADSLTYLLASSEKLDRAIASTRTMERIERVASAVTAAEHAGAALGSGMTYEIGEASLMF